MKADRRLLQSLSKLSVGVVTRETTRRKVLVAPLCRWSSTATTTSVTTTTTPPRQSFSSLAAVSSKEDEYETNSYWDETESVKKTSHNSNDPSAKHCATCTCDHHEHHSTKQEPQQQQQQQPKKKKTLKQQVHDDFEAADFSNDRLLFPASSAQESSSTSAFSTELVQSQQQHSILDDDAVVPLPPPLPEPKFSVRRRVMPVGLIPLNSTDGRRWLVESMTNHTAASYISLTEHFCNQSDPAFCGVTTLQMTLNALAVDPNVRWKGGWRYFGSEDVLLAHCCINPERVRRIGITMEEFGHLATCQGLHVTMKRAMASHPTAEEERNQHKYYSVEHFRRDVQTVLQEDPLQQQDSSKTGILIVSFSRAALGQTGDGHFSPLAAYHAETDQVLVLDVARFKYQPYWVKVDDLYAAMSPRDQATQKPRGWYIVHPPTVSASYKGLQITSEDVRPAALVPTVGQGSPCPVNVIKVDFCKANSYKRRDDQRKEK